MALHCSGIASGIAVGMPQVLQQLQLSPYVLKPRRHRHRKNASMQCRSTIGDGQGDGAPRVTFDAAAASVEVPAVGWLWDRKASISRQSLRQQNIKPKKSLGQNFMMDEEVLASITSAAALSPGDPVLEVGPGTGALTRHLLGAGALVTAVEKDYGLHDRLAEEFKQVPALRLVCGDILRQDLPALLEGMRAEAQQAAAQSNAAVAPLPGSQGPAPLPRVVANLPYNITKDFLVEALPLGARCASLLLMLQDEVAVRLTAVDPGGADWRAMNVILQYYSHPRYLFQIDRRKYAPAPRVHGAVVEFALKPPGERAAVPEERSFLRLVKTSFLQRRKTLRNALQPLVSGEEAMAALEAVGLSPDARAQNLSLDDFVRLAWALEEGQKGGLRGTDGKRGAG